MLYMANPPRRKPGKIPGTRKITNIIIQIHPIPPNKPPKLPHPPRPKRGSTNIRSIIIQSHEFLNPKKPPAGAGGVPHPAAATGLIVPNPPATIQTPFHKKVVHLSTYILCTQFSLVTWKRYNPPQKINYSCINANICSHNILRNTPYSYDLTS